MQNFIYTSRLMIYSVQDRDIDPILRMYEDIGFYGDATGKEVPISRNELFIKCEEIKSHPEAFFYAARNKYTHEFVGCAKGIVQKEYQDLWISLLMIDKKFLRQKYGTEIVTEILGYFKKRLQIRHTYISVRENNQAAKFFWTTLGFEPCKKMIQEKQPYTKSQPIGIYKK